MGQRIGRYNPVRCLPLVWLGIRFRICISSTNIVTWPCNLTDRPRDITDELFGFFAAICSTSVSMIRTVCTLSWILRAQQLFFKRLLDCVSLHYRFAEALCASLTRILFSRYHSIFMHHVMSIPMPVVPPFLFTPIFMRGSLGMMLKPYSVGMQFYSQPQKIERSC
jgi:hypothetical protein